MGRRLPEPPKVASCCFSRIRVHSPRPTGGPTAAKATNDATSWCVDDAGEIDFERLLAGDSSHRLAALIRNLQSFFGNDDQGLKSRARGCRFPANSEQV
jgi:hypothetical protein